MEQLRNGNISSLSRCPMVGGCHGDSMSASLGDATASASISGRYCHVLLYVAANNSRDSGGRNHDDDTLTH